MPLLSVCSSQKNVYFVMAVIFASFVTAASAQTNASPATVPSFKTATAATVSSPVSLFATVLDKKGKSVTDLTVNDFTLTQDGQAQQIQYFLKAGTQPLTLGLVVDTGANQRAALNQERDASRSFVDQLVREETDKAFVIHFDREVELLQDLTSSHEKLDKAIDSLQVPQLHASQGSGSQGGSGQDDDSGQAQGGSYPGGRGSGRHAHTAGGGAQLYDAIYLASNELMKKQTGRKVIVVLSDGVDRGSKESLETALESAQRANTIIYAIFLKETESSEQSGHHGGFGGPGMGGGGGGWGGGMGRHGGGGHGNPQPQESHVDGKKILERLASETGGRFFEVSKKLPIDQVYADIQDSVRNQYVMNFTPGGTESGSYHKLQLTSKKKDTFVQVRDGYYAEAGHPASTAGSQ